MLVSRQRSGGTSPPVASLNRELQDSPTHSKNPYRENSQAEQHAYDDEPGVTPRFRSASFLGGVQIGAAMRALLGIFVDGFAAVRAVVNIVVAADLFFFVVIVVTGMPV